MKVTLSQTLKNGNSLTVNYRPEKFLGLPATNQYARVTRLSPAFRVRVLLRETRQRNTIPEKQQVEPGTSSWSTIECVNCLVTSHLAKITLRLPCVEQ